MILSINGNPDYQICNESPVIILFCIYCKKIIQQLFLFQNFFGIHDILHMFFADLGITKI